MPDRLDEAIRTMIWELVEASPPPPPARSVVDRAVHHRTSWAWWLSLRPAFVAALVLVVGAGGVLLGRHVFPASPSDGEQVRVVAGDRAAEPEFPTAALGTEVLLLPASGTVAPGVGPDLVGDVVAVGRVRESDIEVFTWRIESEGAEGECVEVAGPHARESACSASAVAPELHTPSTFSYRAPNEPVRTVVAWRVPEGTSVVALEVEGLRMWQRPVGGVAAFIVDDDASAVAYARAWSVDGSLVAQIGFSVGDPSTPTVDLGVVEGALPDGRAYLVSGLASAGEAVTGVSAGVMIEFDSGESSVLGITNFFGAESDEPEPWWDGRATLVIPTGDGSIRIAVYPPVLDRLGPEGHDILARAVRGTVWSGLPVLVLEAPLRFATDDEIPLQMQVEYETFAVRRGCDPQPGVVCSRDGLVQAIPLSLLVAPAPPDPPPTIRIESVGWGAFSEATGAVLVFDNGLSGVVALDLDSGRVERRVLDGQRPGDPEYRLIRVGDHLVVGWGTISALALDTLGATSVGEATVFIPAVEPDAVWLIDYPGGRIGGGRPTYRLVTLDGTEVVSATGLDPAVGYPAHGVPGGVVHETDSGITMWYPDAEAVQIPGSGPGFVADVSGDLIAWCEGVCTLHLTAIAGGDRLVSSPEPRRNFEPRSARFSPDGRLLAAVIGDPGPVGPDSTGAIAVIDVASGEATVVTEPLLPRPSYIGWSSDGRHLFFSSYSYGESVVLIGWYRPADGHLEVVTLPFGGTMSFVVLDREEADAFFPAG